MLWFKTPRQRRLEAMTPDQLRKKAERAARYAAEQSQSKAKRDAGLVPMEIWIYPELREPMQRFVAARCELHKLGKEMRKMRMIDPDNTTS